MNVGDIPLFAMLRSRLGYLSQREQKIAQNIANSDTPRYTPEDLKPFSFQAKLESAQSASTPAVTQPGHIGGGSAFGDQIFRPVRKKDSETTLDGNSVVLEEETIKMADARMNYDAAIGFYQKSLSLLRMAAKAPGK
ncbi:flagellar biosynthesis protein FlgB [Phenylobacterium sp.]|uniref:flagellar biosynthesis protein FlgB n=1 Tax=Phenylobacterium sp. TaxID=1871053 RepID=UPI0035B206BB